MLKTPRKLTPLLLALAVVVPGALGTDAANAWHNETVFFEAPAELLSPVTRPHVLSQLQGLGVHGGFSGFQTGLESVGGARKPLYEGFAVPLVVVRHGGGYSLWGLVRPAAGATRLRVLIQRPGSSRYRTLKVVSTRSDGSWSLRSGARGAHWRVSWRGPSGVEYLGPPIGVSS